jgi:E3 ubiquitin-protein ligase SHPRH
MRLMTPYETLAGTRDPSAVHPLLWPTKAEEFEGEMILATRELTRALGQVVYLKNLAKAREDSTDCGSCPICTRSLGKDIEEWGVLPCGHPLCTDCVLELSRRHRHPTLWQRGGAVRLSCPLCRFSLLSSEINIVRPSSEARDEDIKGSPSTKIRGVIRTLVAIQRESAAAKTLVFSSWMETLTLISASLTENGIVHSFLKTPKTFQHNLSEFKTSRELNLLLLPLHSGSRGLNIVEATHVVLVEPGLNAGAELQAIGRVHHMGQTQPTTVHRLIIRDSVEEKIHHLLSSSSSHHQSSLLSHGEGLTLKELGTLFN